MKIRGATVATPMPRPDWKQTDPNKADYICNKPDLSDYMKKKADSDLNMQAKRIISVKCLNLSDGQNPDTDVDIYTSSVGQDRPVLHFVHLDGDPVIIGGVADGIEENDAVTVRQLNTAVGDAAIVVSASGEVISASDASDKKLRGLTLYGKSIQNGTPTPDAPVPIVSSGAESGSINVYALNGISDAQPVITEISYPITVVIGEQAVFSVKAIGNNLTYQWQYRSTATSQTWNNSTSATPGYNTDTLRYTGGEDRNGRPFRCVITDATGNVTYSDVMHLTFGEETVYTSKVYFDKQQISIPTPNGLPGIPVSSGGNYTDANGQQWLSNIKGVTSDVDVVKVLTFTDDMPYEQSTAVITTADNKTLYRYNVSGYTHDFDYVKNEVWRLRFSHGEYRARNTSSDIASSVKNGDMFGFTSSKSPNDSLVGFYTDKPTIDEFKAWLKAQKEAGTPPTVVYKMKEPIVTDHDPIELPNTYKLNTTIANDAGAGMVVEYVADTKAYIDNKFTELAAAIVSNV